MGVIDVQEWRVPEIVHLLGEHLDHCGGPSVSMATGRDLLVKARARDDDTINVWIDGRRTSLPPAIGDLDERGLGDHGADVVVETEPNGLADDHGLVLMTVDAGVDAPPDRRDECRRAADALGLAHLADAGPDAVLRLDDETLKSRTRHVITETARTRAADKAIAAGDWAQLGIILTASHASLRDDFEVSCAELDVATDAALEAGALGARLDVALVPHDRAAAVRELVERRFDDVGWRHPQVRTLGLPKRP